MEPFGDLAGKAADRRERDVRRRIPVRLDVANRVDRFMAMVYLYRLLMALMSPARTALPRKRSPRQAKPIAQFGSDALGLANGRLHPPRRRSDAWVARADRILRKRSKSPPQGRECGIVGYEQVEKIIQVMRSRHDEADFLQQSLEVLFRRMRAVEARHVSQGRTSGGQVSCRL